MDANYRHCRNEKNKSGSHGSFAQSTTKSWLVHFHELLKATEDTALMNCAYAELSSLVMRTSTDTGSSIDKVVKIIVYS